MADQKSFCFVKGELVDCIPGRVQDCNMKQIHTCPLEEEKVKEKSKNKTSNKKEEKETEKPKKALNKKEEKKAAQKAFCFVKGELVDCIPGRVQDCNTKQIHTCPLEEKKEEKETEKPKKALNKKEEKKAAQKAFCFVKGELVDCIPGRVQDCNTKQIHTCP
ncbi:MAG: hypothetical protein IJA34_10505, partial [Lachnospiraceae bacterium]|nr:hypothetical protein [Lachnospiraceae bacterium]